MSLSTETDPRETMRLILDDNASDSDYSNAGTQPSTIDVVEQSPLRIKRNLSGDAIYVWRPTDGTFSQFGANWSQYQESHVIQCEAWTTDSAAQAHALAEDIRSIAFSYATDNKSSTKWQEITPAAELDTRHETQARRADHYREAVQVGLFAARQT